MDRGNSVRKEIKSLANSNQHVPEHLQSFLTLIELAEKENPQDQWNEMIQHLGNRAKDTLLEIFNLKWITTDVERGLLLWC